MATEAGNQPEHRDAGTRAHNQAWGILRHWWFVLVVLVAAVELLLHGWQTRDVIEQGDWVAVKAAVQDQTKAEDLVVTAPSWLDPVGRMHLGDALMTPERVARPDESRFPRATEVALGSARHSVLSAWTVEREVEIGPFVVRRLSNPEHRPVLEDLVAHARADALQVARVMGGQDRPCAWRKGSAKTGPLGFGPAAPSGRFHCDRGAWVAETVVADVDYAPRRCIYAPPPGGDDALRLRFRSVRFGKRLEGHHALYVEAERDGQGPPIRIAFSTMGQPIGEATHQDGQGWVGFGFDTGALEDTSGELTAEITSSSGRRRMYCFEATTR